VPKQTQRNPAEIIPMHSNLPSGYHTVTPYFTVRDASKLIQFLVDSFNASVIVVKRCSNDNIKHARVCIGDSIIMMNESNEEYPENISQIHLYVDNVDTPFSSALEAGAIALMQPNKRPHGDRMAGVKDPCGNVWWIATPE